MNKLKAMSCWWNGHKWDKAHGYRNIPFNGSVCEYCGTVAIIKEATT